MSAKFTVDRGKDVGVDDKDDAVVVADAAADATEETKESLGFKNFNLGDGRTYPIEVLKRTNQSSLLEDCKIS